MDIHSILADHASRREKDKSLKSSSSGNRPTEALIPDLFFDNILTTYKLGRIDILILMFLYRMVWCRPNLYKVYGISPLLSLKQMAEDLGLSGEECHTALRNIESYGFIATLRPGQYFVRRYFTKDWDKHFSQTYDDFEGGL